MNPASRITGEGGGRSFEGRGGLVLIKSERGWRGGGGRTGGQFVHVSYKSSQGDESDGFGKEKKLYIWKAMLAQGDISSCFLVSDEKVPLCVGRPRDQARQCRLNQDRYGENDPCVLHDKERV